MSGARSRLSRLIAVRTVRLRQVAQQLGVAARLAGSLSAVAEQITRLRADTRTPPGANLGYDVSAAATMRAALGAASVRQAGRVVDAEATRAALANDVRQRSLGIDTIVRLIERDAGRAGPEPVALSSRVTKG